MCRQHHHLVVRHSRGSLVLHQVENIKKVLGDEVVLLKEQDSTLDNRHETRYKTKYNNIGFRLTKCSSTRYKTVPSIIDINLTSKEAETTIMIRSKSLNRAMFESCTKRKHNRLPLKLTRTSTRWKTWLVFHHQWCFVYKYIIVSIYFPSPVVIRIKHSGCAVTQER